MSSKTFTIGKILLVAAFSLGFLAYALPIFAQTTSPTGCVSGEDGYCLLQPIPLTNPGGAPDTKVNPEQYIKGIFRLTIALAGGLAVIMLIWAGVKYMSTDAFGGKEEAKGVISNAMWGLGLVLGAYMILYTINPKLLDFNLNIPQQTITGRLGVAPGTPGSGGRQTNCLGDCRHSYTSGSVTVRYRDCLSCSDARSFGLNIKPSIQIVNGKTAQINTELGNKLKALRDTSGNPVFQITEAWPPTVNHANQKQYDGTSVDVRLMSPSASNIMAFYDNARAKGLDAEYEVASEADRKKYIDQGLRFGFPIIVVPYITGEHFSVPPK